jgi:DnaJ-class molecular chaperone
MAKNHWKYEGRPRYNPQVDGYGSPDQWRKSMYERMGFEEAERVMNSAKRTPQEVLGVPMSAMWNEIKSAFRKAAMNCHPDRTEIHGKSREVAEEEFKQVNAAYTILMKQYGEN